MKITELVPWLIRSEGTGWGEYLFVEVRTDEGISGWGEITTTTSTANRPRPTGDPGLSPAHRYDDSLMSSSRRSSASRRSHMFRHSSCGGLFTVPQAAATWLTCGGTSIDGRTSTIGVAWWWQVTADRKR